MSNVEQPARAAVLLALMSCGSPRAPQAPPLTSHCAPRPLDAAPACSDGRAPAPGERVTEFSLGGPETGGDQGSGNVCFGLLLELRYASGVRCSQRIGSFDSIGMGDDVWIDNEPVCLRLSGSALEVRRAGATVARASKQPGMDAAQSYPPRCKD